MRACLKDNGTEPEIMEWLIMVRIDGLTVSITSFRREVGIMSRLQEEDFICVMVLVRSDRVMGSNWSRGAGILGEIE